MKYTKVFAVRVDSELHKWLKEHTQDYIRKILNDYKEGKLVEYKEERRETRDLEISPNETPSLVFSPPNCHYLASDPKDSNYIYCESKRIPLSVCLNRRERYTSVNRTCYPEAKKFTKKKVRKEIDPRIRDYQKRMSQYSPKPLPPHIREQMRPITCPLNNTVTPMKACSECSQFLTCEAVTKELKIQSF